jgi:hypothetical protein
LAINAHKHTPPFLAGKEGRLNGQIIRYLAINGPALIYSIAKELGRRSETKVHYPTVNRRIHDLESRIYVRKVGTRTTKAGAEAPLYATTIKGDFAALALDLTPSEQIKLLNIAGLKQGSPFLLMKRLMDRGLPLEFVQNELLQEVTTGVKNGYINLEVLHNEVICSAFAAAIARKLRVVLGDERGAKYIESVIEVLRSVIATPRLAARPAPQASSERLEKIDLLGLFSQNKDDASVSFKETAGPELFPRARTKYASYYSYAWMVELHENLNDMMLAKSKS